jgi:hypothetical protein
MAVTKSSKPASGAKAAPQSASQMKGAPGKTGSVSKSASPKK